MHGVHRNITDIEYYLSERKVLTFQKDTDHLGQNLSRRFEPNAFAGQPLKNWLS